MVDEADALRQVEHAIGQAVADLARDADGVAQLDQRLQQAYNGRPRQAGLGGQLGERAVRASAQCLEDDETASDGFDDRLRHAGSIVRIADFCEFSWDGR